MLGRLFATAALMAVLTLALLVLRLVVSIALIIVAAAAEQVALAPGYLWQTRRGADRDAVTR